MRSCAAIAVLLLYFPYSANASVLKGVVKENELGGSPFANVEISAPGASPTETDQNGQFTLIFPTKKPGETVLVSVGKAGYVVVNDIQLEQSLPADADAKLLVILIYQQSRREEMARRFYHLDQNRMDEAHQAYDEALKIRRELAQKNPDTYLPAVADTLNNLGMLDSEQNRMDEARQAYDEALGIYQRFAVRDPDRFDKEVERTKFLIDQL